MQLTATKTIKINNNNQINDLDINIKSIPTKNTKY